MQRPMKIAALLLVAASFLSAGVRAADPPEKAAWRALVERSRQSQHESQEFGRETGIRLGSWYCIGPLKDAEYGLFSRSFEKPLGPEEDVIARAAQPADLAKTHHSVPLVGMPTTARRWRERTDFTDGYFHQLPVGPPPSRNETVYLYRTITAEKEVTVEAYMVARDAVKVWLDGRRVLDAPIRKGHGHRFLKPRFSLPLAAGEHRLLVKIVSCFQRHGFSFAIDGMHPILPYLKGQPASSVQNVFNAANRPYASALRQAARGSAAGSRDEEHQQVDRFHESLAEVRSFRFDVEPLPTFEPPVLKMREGLASVGASAGGARYLQRLTALKTQARSALTAYEAGKPEGVDRVIAAAAAIDRFWSDSIRQLGPIVFVRHPSFGRINAPDPYEAPGKAPASIAIFDPAQPDRPPRVIYDDPEGSIFNMSLSYDAKTVFFSAKRKGVAGGWHIYEIGVDGRNLWQITHGDGNDISPLLLPSGRIMFVSNRAGNVLVCQPGRAGVLYVCERDGSEVRRVSGHTLSDHTPQIMDDGRVMFTRWDYGVDKGVFQRQGVWTMNPDGSRLQFFFGNTILDPNSFWQAYPVPGRPEVVSTFGGHHSGPYGVIGLIWNRFGPEAPRGEGFRWLTPEYPTYFDNNFFYGYMDPFPVNERQFLVSYGGDGNRRNRIYLMDDRGNKKCVWEEAELGCYHPILLRPRSVPPVLAPSSEHHRFVYVDPVAANRDPGKETGTFLLSNVYQGLQPHVTPGEVKALQILEQVPKTRPHTGGYAWNVTPTIGRGTFYVRRLIGTVPVQEDGSAYFIAPARRDISLNVLDEQGRVLQKMGSTTQIMPGETQSCIGCHESRASTVSFSQTVPRAARREPSVPKRPDWGTGGIIDYVKVVQPVWDKYCVSCHSGPRPDGNFDLSGDKTRYFNMSYNMLVDHGFVHHIPMNGADHDLTTPKANGSLASRLLTYIDGKHGDVVVPKEDRQRIYTWMDANVPYYHTYLYTDGTVNGARDRWYDDRPDHWFRKDFAPVFMRRCYPCHRRTVDISDAWLGRSVYEVSSKIWTDTTLMDQGLHIENAIRTFGPAHRINLTHPESSQMLTAPLAKDAGGLGLCKDKDGAPRIFKDRSDPDYQFMLKAIRRGHETLVRHPRVDMVSAKE